MGCFCVTAAFEYGSVVCDGVQMSDNVLLGPIFL